MNREGENGKLRIYLKNMIDGKELIIKDKSKRKIDWGKLKRTKSGNITYV